MTFPNIFGRNYTQSELQLLDFLAHLRLFSRLTKKEQSLFLPFMHLRIYKQNEIVFFRNDPSQALYMVKEGKVNIELDYSDEFETIAVLQKNAIFGLDALVHKTKRVYNAMVISPFCQLYVIPQVNIFTIFEAKSVIKAKMMEVYAELMNEHWNALFSHYRSSLGFFDLKEMFRESLYSV